MELSLKGKNALVLGASQGIGAASAFELSLLGARVVLVARNEEKLKEKVSALANPQAGHSYIVCDVKEREKLNQLIENELSKKGTFHIFVNNTGGPQGGPLLEATEAQFLETFENHVLVGSNIVRRLAPGMREAKYGRIINIISTSVKIPIHNLGVSNTIRAAVANWAKTLSVELAPSGITVNNILPGMTKTERLTNIIHGTMQRSGKTNVEVEDDMKKTIPAGRFGEPQEVAAAVAFLASPAAAYINGVSLAVDGGRTGCH